MKALINRGGGEVAVDLTDVPGPEPAPPEAVVEVEAVAVNRGELRLLRARPHGWRRGQDVAGLEELGAGAIVHEIDDAEGPFDLILESAGGACCFSGSDLREQPRFGVGEVADGGVEALL